MSFRARLRMFFALIVILPMIAVALVLFALTGRSETGKADAGVASGLSTSLGLYREAAAGARPALRQVAADEQLRSAIASGDTAAAGRRLQVLAESRDDIVAIELRSGSGRLITRTGSPNAVAPKALRLTARGGDDLGTLSVSVTDPSSYTRRAKALTGLEVTVFRRGQRLASTAGPAEGRPEPAERDGPQDFEISGQEFRGRTRHVVDAAAPTTEVSVFQERQPITDRIADNRLLIGAILLGFLVLSLISATLVSRALQGQIAQFLGAAKRLGRGDFTHPVPVTGHDEFAQLGREFNGMSNQLEAKIEEVERKREELEETIRRVGDALATGLERQGVVELAVRTSVDACEADAGRALPLDVNAFEPISIHELDAPLRAALEAAERAAFVPGPEVGAELLETVDPDAPPPRQRRAVPGAAEGAFALAVPMRSVLGPSDGTPEYVGVMSIARAGREFSREEEELLEYLAGQCVVSIENASLHATVKRQAVTDALTGLANVRAMHSILDREIERGRRFSGSVGLMMLDIDNFKKVNDSHGHQQGDEVLASVAGVLRDFSRDIDAPARYGGEEMAVVLPGTDVDGAVQLAERVREAVERLRVPKVGGRGHLRVTASFGAAALPESASDKEGLIAAADAALYRAKRAGKNRVEQAEPVAAPR
ncbi:MAG TPA: diguanylate cyclase [Thermoleophilaceae bacterium]